MYGEVFIIVVDAWNETDMYLFTYVGQNSFRMAGGGGSSGSSKEKKQQHRSENGGGGKPQLVAAANSKYLGSLSLITFAVLTIAWLTGFLSRLFSVIRFESIIHEFDPWWGTRSNDMMSISNNNMYKRRMLKMLLLN